MKTKILTSILLGMLTLAFIYINPSRPAEDILLTPPPQNNNISERFLIGAMNSALDWDFRYTGELHFNLWHYYTDGVEESGRHYPRGWWWFTGSDDKLFDDINTYKTPVTNQLDNIYSNNRMQSLIMRPKIEYLLYGQRSDYQCEDVSMVNPDLWFYTYQSPDHKGVDIIDGSDTVRHCRLGTDNAGMVVSRLRANTEQSRDSDAQGGNWWQSDSECDWLVKPRIRIDSTLADNLQNFEIPVCRIYVLNQSGNIFKDVTLRVRHFVDEFGNYDGRYLEEFNYESFDSVLTYTGSWGTKWDFKARGNRETDTDNNKADIQVWWYDNCDMWIDYVRVDNDIAHNLFGTGQTHDIYMDWLLWEARDIASHISSHASGSGPSALKFYNELFEFNNIPCMAYVSHKLDSITYSNTAQHIDVVSDFSFYYSYHLALEDRASIQNAGHIVRNYIEKVNAKQIFAECYPIKSGYYLSQQNTNSYSKIPSTLPNTGGNEILGKVVSPVEYDDYLQENFDYYPYTLEQTTPPPRGGSGSGTSCIYTLNEPTQQKGYFRYTMKLADEISKQKDIPFIYLGQAHQWFYPWEVEREPTNEELDVMANIAVTYGARGITYFGFSSSRDAVNCTHSQGICGEFQVPYMERRTVNLYGQQKWNKMEELTERLETWGPTLMSFNNADRHSYIYRDEYERNALLDNSYFRCVLTYKPGTPQVQCNEWLNPGGMPDAPYEPGLIYECKEYTYLQVATFENPNEINPCYFMIVNRRCSPVSAGNPDGRRKIRVLFDNSHSDINSHYNWNIKDVATGKYVDDFNRLENKWVNLDWFEPGEGKLYKLEPIVKTGGVLRGDEVIPSGESFTCEDTVWTNGYNLTIEDGVTIHFSDSAKFIVHGGTFQMGVAQHSGPNTINMDGDNGSWKGFEFDTCNVKIYGVNFSGLTNDSISMLTMIDCPLIDLRSNSFSLGTGSNKGAIDIAFSGSYASGVTDNVYIGSNTFPSSSTALPYVKIMAYSGITIPVIIESNTFTGFSTALFLSNIQGGAVKSNTFTGFSSSLTALSSSLDIYNNTISSTGTYGINALSGTELKMSYAGGLLVGGRNNITNSDSSSSNIYLEDSYFLMDEGENIFDVGYDGWHLYGWFPESYSGAYEEIENCFKVNSAVVNPPVEYVTLGEQGYQITDFVFTPYLTGCTQGDEGDMMVINLGNDIYDTLMYEGQGQGGAAPVGQRHAFDYNSINTVDALQKYIIPPKTVYDSVCIQTRYRNYANVKSLCLYLLNTYPDSMQSLGALSKLYLAVSKTDTTIQGITDLKTLYENLILNHSNNISLVKRSNYYVQKCKVLLHQYSSALSGFQQIINNNPASYEGLVARWDYMATSLLLQGQGGAERNWDFGFGISELSNDEFDDDKSPFTKEERKQIKQTVTTALEVSRYTEKKREKVLTELSTRGDENASRQLKVLKSLEQTVKTEKPKNIVEHLKIVSGDIQKVFVNPNKGKNSNTTFIPQEYRLSQNYPNPFNPTTKISYDIPKNSMVKIIIYDILGREVMKLVNNEFKQPGRYVVEFNGTNLASGVYFYRIEAGDFKMSKKMVLIK